MARKIPLRVVELNGVMGVDSVSQRFDYANVMKQILISPPAPGRGVTYDEMAQVLDAKRPIDKAQKEGEEFVTLSEEQWKTLSSRLDTFQFGFAHEEFEVFGREIKQAREIT